MTEATSRFRCLVLISKIHRWTEEQLRAIGAGSRECEKPKTKGVADLHTTPSEDPVRSEQAQEVDARSCIYGDDELWNQSRYTSNHLDWITWVCLPRNHFCVTGTKEKQQRRVRKHLLICQESFICEDKYSQVTGALCLITSSVRHSPKTPLARANSESTCTCTTVNPRVAYMCDKLW